MSFHLQVEATKFTEVGYHGRDVDSIIKVRGVQFMQSL